MERLIIQYIQAVLLVMSAISELGELPKDRASAGRELHLFGTVLTPTMPITRSCSL